MPLNNAEETITTHQIWVISSLYFNSYLFYIDPTDNKTSQYKLMAWYIFGDPLLDLTLTHLSIDPSLQIPSASEKYPIMRYFVREVCTHVHISATKWCIVGYETGALRDIFQEQT